MRKLVAVPFSSPSKVQLRSRRPQMARTSGMSDAQPASEAAPSASEAAYDDVHKAVALTSPSCTTTFTTKRMTPRRRARLTGSARLPPTDICSPVRLSLPTDSPRARMMTVLPEATEALQYHKQHVGTALTPRFTRFRPSHSTQLSPTYSSPPARLSPLSKSVSPDGGPKDQKEVLHTTARRRFTLVALLLLLVLVSAGCGALATVGWREPKAAPPRHESLVAGPRGLTRLLLLPSPPPPACRIRWRAMQCAPTASCSWELAWPPCRLRQ